MEFADLVDGHDDLKQLLDELGDALPHYSEKQIAMAVAFLTAEDLLSPETGAELWQRLTALCPGTGGCNFPNLAARIESTADFLNT